MTEFKKRPSAMDKATFIEAFGGVYEHSPWVAEAVWNQGVTPVHDVIETLAEHMAKVVESADKERKMSLINAHPDLAGKAAVRGELTAASTTEQSGAGLGDCTAEEFEKFQAYNDAYKEKFGFPFIKAVKNSNRHEIIAGFEARIGNNPDQEFKTALLEIDKIARFRLLEM
ncbi:2-oxo-4-hydroxy-4-carboxy-5-ureidoimidazoline decarboxylase [Sneathiella marina]|uniref:2-oxo-4-hydroxy-4-carboxy-5-ureidoimidazoline decarboxylase n=1 Tax=Sneathiella marina TaxID=2950108 RepID=A0ABY4W601_9PROT|nr:2-oxo-4-hydroxy-4-carboxy-5-ureidoimidazoline decarboxylase [Sneathiella marina]USG62281.1 2-oxo-4-hydroxy-4-carboxy-5-ureidoimidazoline decarboxylase [Sneathiella marina]